MIIFLLFMKLASNVWCEESLLLDTTTRIQKHVVGKAAIYDEMKSKTFHLHLEELFTGDQLDKAWRTINLDCNKAGISDNEESDPHYSRYLLFTDDSSQYMRKREISSNFTEVVKIRHQMKFSDYLALVLDLKQLFDKVETTNAIFKIGSLRQFLKEAMNLNDDKEEYFDHLLPYVSMKPTKCLTLFRTISLTVTYPTVKHFGESLEVWDAGILFQYTYYYVELPFDVIQVGDRYFQFDAKECQYEGDLLLCPQSSVTHLNHCTPENYRSCHREVEKIQGVYRRCVAYFCIIITPENRTFVKTSASSAAEFQLLSLELYYFTFGPHDSVVFDGLGVRGTPEYRYGRLLDFRFNIHRFNYTNGLSEALKELELVMKNPGPSSWIMICITILLFIFI